MVVFFKLCTRNVTTLALTLTLMANQRSTVVRLIGVLVELTSKQAIQAMWVRILIPPMPPKKGKAQENQANLGLG